MPRKKKVYDEAETAISEEKIRTALQDITVNKLSLRQASVKHGVPKSTLYYRNQKSSGIPDFSLAQSVREKNNKYASRQVFTNAEELELVNELIRSAKLAYGMTTDEFRELVYWYGRALHKKLPDSWEVRDPDPDCQVEGMAGMEWCRGFLARHKKKISLRRPQNTSKVRLCAFNKRNVTIYIENLKEVMRKHCFAPRRIFNLDESSLSTVLPPPRVYAELGERQVPQATPGERGETITIVGIVNAVGEFIPPVYIFPRATAHPSYLEGAIPKSIGFHNKKGYMNSELFVKTLQHMHSNVSPTPTPEDPILLILDNHVSHLSLEAIKYCRAMGIVMVTLPPHTSHKLQPLDLSVFRPFKVDCSKDFHSLQKKFGVKVDVPNIVRNSRRALEKSFSRENIRSGFITAGICPFNFENIHKQLAALEKLVRDSDLPENDGFVPSDEDMCDVMTGEEANVQQPQANSLSLSDHMTPPVPPVPPIDMLVFNSSVDDESPVPPIDTVQLKETNDESPVPPNDTVQLKETNDDFDFTNQLESTSLSPPENSSPVECDYTAAFLDDLCGQTTVRLPLDSSEMCRELHDCDFRDDVLARSPSPLPDESLDLILSSQDQKITHAHSDTPQSRLPAAAKIYNDSRFSLPQETQQESDILWKQSSTPRQSVFRANPQNEYSAITPTIVYGSQELKPNADMAYYQTPQHPRQVLQSLRPIPLPSMFIGNSRRVNSRAITSTIATGSPEMKKKEDKEEIKRLTLKVAELKRQLREKNREHPENQNPPAKKKKKPSASTETEKSEKPQKKRGRPPKNPRLM